MSGKKIPSAGLCLGEREFFQRLSVDFGELVVELF